MENNLTLQEMLDSLNKQVSSLPKEDKYYLIFDSMTKVLNELSLRTEEISEDIENLYDDVDEVIDIMDEIVEFNDEENDESDDTSEQSDDAEDDSDDPLYEVICPNCHEKLYFVKSEFSNQVTCSFCGEVLDVTLE